MVWFLHAILEIVAMIVAFFTNWIVVLFADEKGWLPKCLTWWQTFDNTLDVGWMISEHCVPSWAEYDYDKHYRYHYENKGNNYVIPGYVDILDPNFTTKERFQRYVCRVCWLYRNSNYGFSYYVNGIDLKVRDDLVILKRQNDSEGEEFLGYDKTTHWYNLHWCFYYEKPWCKWFILRIYLGWKMKSCDTGRHMLAIFFSPFRLVNK